MAELAVYDDTERERLRHALKQFKRSRGNLGDSKIFCLMRDILDPRHLVYVSQSTIQRFIRNIGRTEDEGVWAIKTFLDRVSPSDMYDDLAKALADTFLVPVATIPPVFQPVETYQGRYEFYFQSYTGEFFETKFGEPHAVEFILFPSADPRYFQVRTHNPEDELHLSPSLFFLRCGAYQFLLLGTAILGTTTFTLLSHIEDDPLVLQGTMMQTAEKWPPQESPYEFRLVRTYKPKLERKLRPGQYGSGTKKPSQ